LDRELEHQRRAARPRRERGALGQTIETVVDLDGIEARSVVLEPFRLGQAGGIEIAAPVFVLPPGAPDTRAPAPHGGSARPGKGAVNSRGEESLGDERVQDAVARVALEVEDETGLLGRER